MNVYAYVGGNTANLVDPMGLDGDLQYLVAAGILPGAEPFDPKTLLRKDGTAGANFVLSTAAEDSSARLCQLMGGVISGLRLTVDGFLIGITDGKYEPQNTAFVGLCEVYERIIREQGVDAFRKAFREQVVTVGTGGIAGVGYGAADVVEGVRTGDAELAGEGFTKFGFGVACTAGAMKGAGINARLGPPCAAPAAVAEQAAATAEAAPRPPQATGSAATGPETVTRENAALQRCMDSPDGLRRVAIQAHDALNETAARNRTVSIARVRLQDGRITHYASGSGSRLDPAQVEVLMRFGVPRENILTGAGYRNGFSALENHAERVILRNLPDGAVAEDWGICWASQQKPIPCSTCSPHVQHAGGMLQLGR